VEDGSEPDRRIHKNSCRLGKKKVQKETLADTKSRNALVRRELKNILNKVNEYLKGMGEYISEYSEEEGFRLSGKGNSDYPQGEGKTQQEISEAREILWS